MSIMKKPGAKNLFIIKMMKRSLLLISRYRLLIAFKSFIRPNLDCGETVYYKSFNDFFKENIELYHVSLVITLAVRVTFNH